ncbi:MAG: hypothetical protein H7329_12485 [Opitutaceae bacterium]|nr:hypothetical protein [Cytophagales bacterium]
MGLESVAISVKVRLKLSHLIYILYEKEYFGFWKTAEIYVDSIYDTIFKIPQLKHSKTANPKLGHFFVRHKANENTTYYIIFDKKDNRYLVKDIISNHDKLYSKVILKP